MRIDCYVSYLSRVPRRAGKELATQDDASADARADGEEHEIIDTLACTEALLTQRGEVRVVAYDHRQFQTLAEHGCHRRVIHRGKVWRMHHGTGDGVDGPRRGDADRDNWAVFESGLCHRGPGDIGHLGDNPLRAVVRWR